jgi:type I restriction enzyme M protein
VLPDERLPASLTADWQADEANAGKPFPSYARLLPKRGVSEGDSRCSWTVDLAARRAEARQAMHPLLDEAARIKAEVVDLKDQLKRLKKDKAGGDAIEAIDTQIRGKEKAARELEAQAAGIDAAVFDLKAVNPNAVTRGDERSPEEIIRCIEGHGRTVAQALARLQALLAGEKEELAEVSPSTVRLPSEAA